jgi:hypothetical protein
MMVSSKMGTSLYMEASTWSKYADTLLEARNYVTEHPDDPYLPSELEERAQVARKALKSILE